MQGQFCIVGLQKIDDTFLMYFMLELEYIVTGTGRCGTLFLANFLTSSGTPCTHEAIFTPKGLDFDVLEGRKKPVNSGISRGDNLAQYEQEIRAESSYMSAPYLHKIKKPRVIHLIRSPQKVVSSFLCPDFEYFSFPYPSTPPQHISYETFIYKKLPQLGQDMPKLDRACLYWIEWNEMIESSGRVNYTHRIEDSTEKLEGFIGSKANYSKISNASKIPGPKWSPSEIQSPSIRKRLLDLAKKYKYVSVLH